MSTYADRLSYTVQKAATDLAKYSDEEASYKLSDSTWSPKQIIGHLVDSASNNHQRFVRASLEEKDLIFPGYQQDQWVTTQQYQQTSWTLLLELWKSYNLHLANFMKSIPEAARQKERIRHNLDQIAFKTVPKNQSTTLDYFMEDYVDHLEHHLKQVYDGITEKS